MSGKNKGIMKYLEEELRALVPVYQEGKTSTLVLTVKGEHQDKRSLQWLAGRVADYYGMDLKTLRKQYSPVVGQKHHISVPINPNLVLLPVKLRQAVEPGETTVGYVNFCQVEGVEENQEDSLFRCRIKFRGEDTPSLNCLNSYETLRSRMEQGKVALEEYLRRQRETVKFAGPRSGDLLQVMPSCDCILKDIFEVLLTCAGDFGKGRRA